MTYNEKEASDSMQANAPRSGASLFTALSGDLLHITATSQEEAQQKLEAYWGNTSCPCGIIRCDCVTQGEVQTRFIDTL